MGFINSLKAMESLMVAGRLASFEDTKQTDIDKDTASSYPVGFVSFHSRLAVCYHVGYKWNVFSHSHYIPL